MTKHLGAFLLILVGSSGIIAPAHSALVYFAETGHYYGLTQTALSWTDAEAEANSAGGHLVSINSQAEQDFIVATFLNALQDDATPFWIGLTDQVEEGDFVWSSGEALTYTN